MSSEREAEWEERVHSGGRQAEMWEGEGNGAMLRCPREDGQTDNFLEEAVGGYAGWQASGLLLWYH